MSNYQYITNASLTNITYMNNGNSSYQYALYDDYKYPRMKPDPRPILDDLFRNYDPRMIVEYLVEQPEVLKFIEQDFTYRRYSNAASITGSRFAYVVTVNKKTRIVATEKHAKQIATANFPHRDIDIHVVDLESLAKNSIFRYKVPRFCPDCLSPWDEGSFDGNIFVARGTGKRKIECKVMCEQCWQKR